MKNDVLKIAFKKLLGNGRAFKTPKRFMSDFLDLLVALSACAIGYGYIGKELYEKLGAKGLENHTYREWILTYSGKEFQDEIKEFEDFLNSYSNQTSKEKFDKLNTIFGAVVRLETAFWQHALTMNLEI